MVRILEKRLQPDDINYVKLAGLADDDKPLNYATGSEFLEVDTGDVYLFDETDGGTWKKVGGTTET